MGIVLSCSGCQLLDSGFRSRLGNLIDIENNIGKGISNYNPKGYQEQRIQELEIKYAELNKRLERYNSKK